MALTREEVTELQNLLNDYFYVPDRIPVTGIYDAATRKQVLRYQKEQEISQDGDAGDITMALLRGNRVSIQMLPDPPVTIEPYDEWICWADSLWSFLQATHDGDNKSPDDWVGLMDYKNLTGENDGLKPLGWAHLIRDLQLQGVLYTDTFKPTNSLARPRKLFGADTLYRELKRNGYLILLYNLSGGHLAHVIVVFGVELNPGRSESHYVLMMDPWRVGRVRRDFTDLADRSVVGIISKSPGQYAFQAVEKREYMPTSI